MPRPEITRDEDHQYWVGGERFPSVTQIIGLTVPEAYLLRKLLQERGRAAQNIKRAGKRGSVIHEGLDHYGKTGEVPDDMPPALARWIIANKPQFLAQEIATCSLTHRYAGTFDARIMFHAGPYKGKVVLGDFKTGRKITHDQYFPQLIAYEHAEIECGEPASNHLLIIHVPPEGEVQMIEVTDTWADFQVLLGHYDSITRRQERLAA